MSLFGKLLTGVPLEESKTSLTWEEKERLEATEQKLKKEKRRRGYQSKIFVWYEKYETNEEKCKNIELPNNEEEKIKIGIQFFNVLADQFITFGPEASMSLKGNTSVTFLDILEGLPFYIFFGKSQKDQKRVTDMSKEGEGAKRAREKFVVEMRMAMTINGLVDTRIKN